LMATQRPVGIVIISIISFLIGAFYIINGALFLGVGGQLSVHVGGVFKAVGVMLMFLGSLQIVMAIGLLLMAQWARKWAADFYGLMAGLAILLALFDLYMILPAITYLLFYFYLKRSKTIRAFGDFGYEAPKMHEEIAKRQHVTYMRTIRPENVSDVEHEPVLPRKSRTTIPENMILCPQCQTMNLRKDKYCKMCASDLH
jgi:hypothetical protein